MTRRLVPIVRRLAQAAGLGLLVALPLMALYTHYKEAHAIHDLGDDNWRNVAVRGIESLVGQDARRKELAEQTHGTLWSARLFGVSLSDPLAGAEAMLSSRSFYAPLLWSLAIPLAVTAVLGRVFCGWVCPMNTLLEAVDKLRRLLRLAEIRERDVRFSLGNKYLVLAVVLGIAAATRVPFIAMFYPPAMMSREAHLYVFSSAVGVGAYIVLAICAVELFVSKRWWCRYVCPGGALYSLLGRFRVVRVARNDKKCIQCGDCVRVCQFGLRPMQVAMTGMECTNCGSCVRACNDDALRFALVAPLPTMRSPAANGPSGPRQGATGDNVETVSIRLALLLLAATLVAVSPRAALAHHILGLPHYSYKENYPQAPTLEYPATTGPYDVLMTSFPGQPVPGERTTIAFYIKDRETGLPYDRPVTLRVLQTATFGANTVVMEPTMHEPSTNQHKFFLTFPTDAEYIVELTMDVEGQTEAIPFLLVAGEPSAASSVSIAGGIGLGAFLLVVRAIRIKRKRSAARQAAATAR